MADTRLDRMVFFVITALMWLVPDRRMERALAAHTK
jgi:hypothetical protein